MNDRAVNLLEQYDIEVFRTRKGRGAFLCDTSAGCLILREYNGNEEKTEAIYHLLNILHEKCEYVEQILKTKEGELLVKDREGAAYLLKTCRDGRECNIADREECLESVKMLAKLHLATESCDPAIREALRNMDENSIGIVRKTPGDEFEKHNREMRRVRKYLKQRSQKTWFEICLQQNLNYFLDQAQALTKEWQAFEDRALREEKPVGGITFCHGDYQYHNLIRSGQEWFIINFEKCVLDDPVRDLYLFMRKMLEKSDWSIPLGKSLLNAYESVRPLSDASRKNLYYRLAYPEKFWKIVNFYNNSGKAWIPGRNLEKLEKVLEQEDKKLFFLQTF